MKSQDWISLSLVLDENTLAFPGDEGLKLTWDKTLDRDDYNLSNVSLSMHLGTHIDYKKHVFKEENEEGFSSYIGLANVIFLHVKNGLIRTDDIRMAYQYLENKSPVLLIHTGHGSKINTEAYYDYPKFDKDIFGFLINNQIKILGADMPSYEYQDGHMLKMHKDLLGQDIYLIENLVNLDKLSSLVELIVLPLPIKGLEASLINVMAKKL
jgi:kynurenine formamidase